ncbi:MAG: HD domain-containing protein [Bacteroidia bacterium]|nr:HD domain-containing protein [Bacteroidia bacterium]
MAIVQEFVKNAEKDPFFRTLAAVLQRHQIQAFLIGGYVRDLFLGRPCKDIDITVIGDGTRAAQLVADELGVKGEVHIFKNFGTAMFKYQDLDIEFVGARKESYSNLSRKPAVSIGSLADDQNRRDFTINALAISLSKEDFGSLLDPFNGMADLHVGVIRTPLDPLITYSDDPLRMMRAIRFATQLNFNIEPASFQAIRTQKKRIEIISKERIADELNKIILSGQPSVGFKLLRECGLLPLIFPELSALEGVETRQGKSHKDNFFHTLEVLDNLSGLSPDLWLRWAALLHDIAKPSTKRFDPDQGWTFHGHEDKGARMVPGIFRNLKLPMNEKMKYVQKLVLLHLRPIVLAKSEVSDSAVRRLLFEAGDDIDDLMKLCQADVTTKNEYKQKKYRANFELVKQKLVEVEEKDKVRNWQPPVTGELIMQEFNLKPGREIGLIKNAIREAILDGIIPNEYEAAYAFMLERAREIGLTPVNKK